VERGLFYIEPFYRVSFKSVAGFLHITFMMTASSMAPGIQSARLAEFQLVNARTHN